MAGGSGRGKVVRLNGFHMIRLSGMKRWFKRWGCQVRVMPKEKGESGTRSVCGSWITWIT